jgi:hypothetical protein
MARYYFASNSSVRLTTDKSTFNGTITNGGLLVGAVFPVPGTTTVLIFEAEGAGIARSTDNGANWNIMTTVPAITGTFNWNIPLNLASSDMKIKIADATKI